MTKGMLTDLILKGEVPTYFTFEKGEYSTKPGLTPLRYDSFGNKRHDGCLFQIDDHFEQYRSSKERARYCMENYYQTVMSPYTQAHISRWMTHWLCDEHPNVFGLTTRASGKHVLECTHTDEVLVFSPGFHQVYVERGEIDYITTLDALAMQVQEDISFLQKTDESNYISMMHFMSPTGISARDLIECSFFEMHAEVPGMTEEHNVTSKRVVNALSKSGPYVRFLTAFTTHSRLDICSNAPLGLENEWIPQFNDSTSNFFIRVERQTTTPFPNLGGFLFTVKPTYMDASSLSADRLDQLGKYLDDRAKKNPNAYFMKKLPHLQRIVRSILDNKL